MKKKVLLPEDYKKGFKVYKDNNKSARRVKLEEQAEEIMFSYTEENSIIDFVGKDFLDWLRSRIDREKYRKLLDEEQLKKFIESIRNADNFNDEGIRNVLKSAMKVYGIGPVGASAMLTLIRPEEFGVVNKYVVKALNLKGFLHVEANENGKSLSLEDAVCVEKALREIARETNLNKDKSFQPLKFSGECCNRNFTPRDIDVALWGIGKMSKHK